MWTTKMGVEKLNLSQTALSPRNQKVNPRTTYYSQRDPRWAGKYLIVSNVRSSQVVYQPLAKLTGILGGNYFSNNSSWLSLQQYWFIQPCKSEAGTDSDGIMCFLVTGAWREPGSCISGWRSVPRSPHGWQHVRCDDGVIHQWSLYPWVDSYWLW